MSYSIQSYQSYNEERKDWTKKATPLFKKRYREHFGVSDAEIYDVENAIDRAYQADVPLFREIIQQVDFAGADKILSTPRQTIMLAERTRRKDLVNGYRRDPSLRFSTDGGHPPPYEKWTTAVETDTGFYPALMAFGILTAGVGQAIFDTFALIKMRPWLEAINEGRIDSVGSNGTNAYYYPINRLREIDGCILYEE